MLLNKTITLATKCLLIGIIIGLAACEQANENNQNTDLSQSVPLVINAKQAVLEKLHPSRNADFATREIIWEQTIEQLAPEFYRNVIWGASDHPQTWQEDRKEALADLLAFYDTLSPTDIAAAYDLFEKQFENAYQKTKQSFPDYQANLTIMIAPGVSWGGSYINLDPGEYLALGVDWYLGQKGKYPDQTLILRLIIHELFHDYHGQKRGTFVTEETYRRDGKLYWQLWEEGMASWGMGAVNADQSPQTVMLLGFENYERCRDSALARLFLEEIDNKAIDPDNPITVKKWFGVASTKALGADTPTMIGYYLGWRTIRLIEESGITPSEFLSWDYEEARPHIISALQKIAAEPPCI